MSDTPRTDALMVELANTDQDDLSRLVDLAGELERENARLLAHLDTIRFPMNNKTKTPRGIAALPPLPCSAVIMRRERIGPDSWREYPEEVLVWAYIEGEGALISIGHNLSVLPNTDLLEPNNQKSEYGN